MRRFFPLSPTQRLQALPKGRHARLSFWIILRIVHEHRDPPHPLGLLRACRKRPRSRSATQAANEISTIEGPRGICSPAWSVGIVVTLSPQAGAGPWERS
jgi:hypothetical protein